MDIFKFKIFAKDFHSQARTGIIHTFHGDIKTPAFVPVGTQATVKSLSNQELLEIGTQIFFINTYHLYLRPGLELIKKIGGLHQFVGWNRPLWTDSAGFQIFSLGDFNRKKRLKVSGEEKEIPLVKIEEEGVTFRSHFDGSEHLFTPEKSIEAQVTLGGDIMMAFDECTYYPATHAYAEKAMERTHRWAVRCLEENAKRPPSPRLRRAGKTQNARANTSQVLYGVIQGGVFEDLRTKSARYIDNLPFAGNAIGGVSVGESKEEMRLVLDRVIPLLSEEKPRHLLGVGEIDDIFVLVERGIDSFDCVMPTRLGRMGHFLVQNSKFPPSPRLQRAGKIQNSKKWTLDITKAEFAQDKEPLDRVCDCFVCQNYSRAYLNHLFRTRELLAYRLLTYHNLYFMETLMREIREAIAKRKFRELKSKWL